MWVWLSLTIMALVAVICFVQYRAQRGTYRSLSSRQPERKVTADTPLGMEAIDIDAVNRTTRRNEALERSQTSFTLFAANRRGAADTDIHPLADDETYARRFHTAFLKDKKD